MGWKEKWEDFKESLLHHGKAKEEKEEKSEMMAGNLDERRKKDLHRTDETTGSETLDD